MKETFDDVLYLEEIKAVGTDRYGNPAEKRIKTKVLCDVKSVDKVQYYRAGQQGLRLSYLFIINEFEYGGQKLVTYAGTQYDVIRTYRLDGGLLELTAAEKEGVKA